MPNVKWPAPDDYQRAVLEPARAFRDPRLRAMKVETAKRGGFDVPWARSGNFGQVYRFKKGGETLAVKVFTRGEPERHERYALIAAHLRGERSRPPLVSFNYDPEGALIDGARFPTLIMEWAGGEPLDVRLEDACEDGRPDNGALCAEWAKIMRALADRKVAHGDLQHGNVLVDEKGGFRLVDYDGMFVPAMRKAGLAAAELGLPGYQHPRRADFPFDERSDDFSALVMLLSLACLDGNRRLSHGGGDEGLLFRRDDFLDPEASPLFQELAASPDAPVKKLAAILKRAARGSAADIPRFDELLEDARVREILAPGWRCSPAPAPKPKPKPRPAPAPVKQPAPAGKPAPAPAQTGGGGVVFNWPVSGGGAAPPAAVTFPVRLRGSQGMMLAVGSAVLAAVAVIGGPMAVFVQRDGSWGWAALLGVVPVLIFGLPWRLRGEIVVGVSQVTVGGRTFAYCDLARVEVRRVWIPSTPYSASSPSLHLFLRGGGPGVSYEHRDSYFSAEDSAKLARALQMACPRLTVEMSDE